MEFLKENAQAFCQNALDLLAKGSYRLAAFSAEQALQLVLKYFLAKKMGDYPKTHALRRLFLIAGTECPVLERLFKENLALVGDMEGAFMGARYYPVDYLREEVEEMVAFLKRVMEAVEECL